MLNKSEDRLGCVLWLSFSDKDTIYYKFLVFCGLAFCTYFAGNGITQTDHSWLICSPLPHVSKVSEGLGSLSVGSRKPCAKGEGGGACDSNEKRTPFFLPFSLFYLVFSCFRP